MSPSEKDAGVGVRELSSGPSFAACQLEKRGWFDEILRVSMVSSITGGVKSSLRNSRSVFVASLSGA